MRALDPWARKATDNHRSTVAKASSPVLHRWDSCTKAMQMLLRTCICMLLRQVNPLITRHSGFLNHLGVVLCIPNPVTTASTTIRGMITP